MPNDAPENAIHRFGPQAKLRVLAGLVRVAGWLLENKFPPQACRLVLEVPTAAMRAGVMDLIYKEGPGNGKSAPQGQELNALMLPHGLRFEVRVV